MTESKYESFDPREFELISATALVGHLGVLTNDGYPRVIPVNFVADGNKIYFHGAVHGEKHELISAAPPVTFNMYIPYSVIPSYWISGENAGGATMYFKSVLIKGRCAIIDQVDEKVHALMLLMAKYQPEGGYVPITTDEPAYRSILEKTAIFRIDADQISLRVKFHQKKSSDFKLAVMRNLEKRRQGPDLATAEVLKGMLETSED